MTTAILPLAASRPKVHKLPGMGRSRTQKKSRVPGFLLFWGTAIFALMMLSVSMKKELVVKEATMLPAVSVVSNRLPPAAHEEGDTVLSASIADAQAAPTPPPAYTKVEKPGTTITLKDKSGSIVGQMARIPVENEQITEVKAINTVDNGSGHELLSILNKY